MSARPKTNHVGAGVPISRLPDFSDCHQPTTNKEAAIVTMRRENGKVITVDDTHRNRVGLIVWRKSGAPLLPLVLDTDEAEALIDGLRAAIAKAASQEGGAA